MNATQDRERNLELAQRLVKEAAAKGAALVALPEHFGFMQAEGRRPPQPEPLRGPTFRFLSRLARELGIWIVGGSFSERIRGDKRVYNSCVVVDDAGRFVGSYRKIHLFDLALPGQRSLFESAYVKGGRRVVCLDGPVGKMGISICYDLRFPELYRRQRLMGAEVFVVPSAFTYATGKAHWELLVRARAVENACYVLAPAQWGDHGRGRRSYGKAMIVDPWGQVLGAMGEEGDGVVVADVSAEHLARCRRKLDSTMHAKCLPAAWRRAGGAS